MYASRMQQRRHTSGPPPLSTTDVAYSSSITATSGIPNPNDNEIRPTSSHSCVSVTSTNSNFHSSLLDSDLFDAFPSVPENNPLLIPPFSASAGYTHMSNLPVVSSVSQHSNIPWLKREIGLGHGQGLGAAGRKQSFDVALMEGTGHLNGRAGAGALTASTSVASGATGISLMAPFNPHESAPVLRSGYSRGVPPSR
jgi:hypothetical protein